MNWHPERVVGELPLKANVIRDSAVMNICEDTGIRRADDDS